MIIESAKKRIDQKHFESKTISF